MAIRITDRLDPGDIPRRLGFCRLMTIASPAYLAQHGRPAHPAELAAHACLGYSPQVNDRPWSFLVDGRLETFPVAYRLQANNGDALTAAAARGLGITVQPEFIAADYLAAGQVETLLDAFAPPALGIYALLASNRYIPHRVRVLVEFLAERLGADAGAAGVPQ